MDVVTYALLKKKIEQGGGGKLPENNVLYNQIEIPGEIIGWKGTPLPTVENPQHVDKLYINTELSVEETNKILDAFPIDGHGVPLFDTEAGLNATYVYGEIGGVGEGNAKGIIIKDFNDTNDTPIALYVSPLLPSLVSAFGLTHEGWTIMNGKENFVEINSKLGTITEFVQLGQLDSIFSTTPFEPITAEPSKGNILVNSKGEELLPNMVNAKRDTSTAGFKGNPFPAGVDQNIQELVFNTSLSIEETNIIITRISKLNSEALILGDSGRDGNALVFYAFNGNCMIQAGPNAESIEFIYLDGSGGPEFEEIKAQLGFSGWNPKYINKKYQYPISFKNIINVSQEIANEISKLMFMPPFEEVPGELLESAQLKDNRGVNVFPKTKISQILNNDGTPYKPAEGSEPISLKIPKSAVTVEGKSQKAVLTASMCSVPLEDLMKSQQLIKLEFNIPEGQTSIEPYVVFVPGLHFNSAVAVDYYGVYNFFETILNTLRIQYDQQANQYTAELIEIAIPDEKSFFELVIDDYAKTKELKIYNPDGGTISNPVLKADVSNLVTMQEVDDKLGLFATKDELTNKADKSELLDKADRATYATGSGGILQVDALTILNAYDNYEGKIIEFYANETAPDKLISIGWVMKTLDTSEPVLIEIDRNGHTIKWTKDTNYKTTTDEKRVQEMIDASISQVLVKEYR